MRQLLQLCCASLDLGFVCMCVLQISLPSDLATAQPSQDPVTVDHGHGVLYTLCPKTVPFCFLAQLLQKINTFEWNFHSVGL